MTRTPKPKLTNGNNTIPAGSGITPGTQPSQVRCHSSKLSKLRLKTPKKRWLRLGPSSTMTTPSRKQMSGLRITPVGHGAANGTLPSQVKCPLLKSPDLCLQTAKKRWLKLVLSSTMITPSRKQMNGSLTIQVGHGADSGTLLCQE